ncbi:MAG: Gfo/Idh/MocA family oxidoreductase [Gemmataceae bacterium]
MNTDPSFTGDAMTDLTRRSFFVSAGSAAASTVVGDAARGVVANETIGVGIVGSGGRARHLMKSLVNIEKVKVVSVCDVWYVARDEAKKMADANAKTTSRSAEVFADKNVAAVLIGSPDHWHVPLTIAAVEAKKDVYVEKPLTHDSSEGRKVITAVKDSKCIVQVGTQQRSMPHIQKAKELVAKGRLGKVVKVRMSWNRNTDRVRKNPLGVKPEQVQWDAFLGSARKQPFDEYRFRNWRWFWDFGGGIFTDLMVHWVDVAHFVLGVDQPERAVSLGEFVTAKGVWETPDAVQTILNYPNGLQMHFEGTFSNSNKGAHIEFLGTAMNLYVDRGRYELTPERGKPGETEKLILGSGPPGLDFYDKPDGERLHLENWIDCIRTRKTPHAPVEAGVASAQAAHLANRALRETMAKPNPVPGKIT